MFLQKNHPYITLSYTWGSSSNRESFSSKLPDQVPLTVKDAISVTISLNYTCLWIDRYCIDQRYYIDQNNKNDVAEQVGKMDLIYQNSELTLVAAAGKDPSYGLPGVSSRARSLQASGAFGGLRFV